jgi:hypothetical protein
MNTTTAITFDFRVFFKFGKIRLIIHNHTYTWGRSTSEYVRARVCGYCNFNKVTMCHWRVIPTVHRAQVAVVELFRQQRRLSSLTSLRGFSRRLCFASAPWRRSWRSSRSRLILILVPAGRITPAFVCPPRVGAKLLHSVVKFDYRPLKVFMGFQALQEQQFSKR